MNLEPIRALIKLAGDLENQLYEGDGAYPEDYHDVHTSAVVALPALSQLLEAVEGMEKLTAEYEKLSWGPYTHPAIKMRALLSPPEDK